MQSNDVVSVEVDIARSSRVIQLEGMFDIPPAQKSRREWRMTLPLDEREWKIGLIVGASGSGKSTIARAIFGVGAQPEPHWPDRAALVDGFDSSISLKTIVALLSSVGLSSPPCWLKPFAVLSTGEQFRASVARKLSLGLPTLVIDEFTSTVDRTVATVASSAIAKAIRSRVDSSRFVAVTCHYDVLDWLQPDWVYDASLNTFVWRDLQCRPPITLAVRRVGVETWPAFARHRYLSADINRSSKCFLFTIDERPCAFVAVLPVIGFRRRWREHRAVCLPDFQGVGIGMAASSTVAAIVIAATEARYFSSTTHPAFIQARTKKPALWRLTAQPSFRSHHSGSRGSGRRISGHSVTRNNMRLMATHEYVGEPFESTALARLLWTEPLPPRDKPGDGDASIYTRILAALHEAPEEPAQESVKRALNLADGSNSQKPKSK